MNKVIVAFATMALTITMLFAAPAVAEPQNIWYCGPEDGDRIVNVHDRSLHVVVQEGANCTIKNSTVKSVRAVNTAHDIKVWNTEVVRGTLVKGATGTVHIGVRHCNFDPEVGNNVKVKNSHNVLICYVTAGNNIEVVGNDGRVTVRNSNAGNLIKVNRNKKYVHDAGYKHIAPQDIRLIENRAEVAIQFFHNHKGRDYRFKSNSPEPIVK